MDLNALKVFLAVAHERSFSRAAAKVHRTQPAVSQAVRRLEVDLGEQLFDRSSKNGTLTEAGRCCRTTGIVSSARRGNRIRSARAARPATRACLIGANEAAVHTLLPRHRAVQASVSDHHRRAPRAARQIAVEVQQGSLDWPLTFTLRKRGCSKCPSAATSSALLVPPRILAKRKQVTMEDVAEEPVVAHNDPSPARERVLRLFNSGMCAADGDLAASLDGIKRAVELQLGVAMLPRRCAVPRSRMDAIAVPVAGVSRRRQVMIVCAKASIACGGRVPRRKPRNA